MRSASGMRDGRGRRFSSLVWILVSRCLFFVQTTTGLRRRCRTPLFLVMLTLGALGLLSPANSPGHDTADTQPIGIEERLGAVVPSDITLADEQGQEVPLGTLVKRPTIVTLVYYQCGRFCPQLLAGLAAAVPRVKLAAGTDYQIMTVSFDAADTPVLARDLKKNYLKAVQGPFPADAWRFLTGDRRNIERLCAAAGFSFRKESHGFAHPVALIILSPERRIIRYIPVSKFFYGVEYPMTFSAIDLSQALVAAVHEKVSAATDKEFLYCFPHEPHRQQAFYTILSIAGLATIFSLGTLFIYLAAIGRKPQKGKGP